MEGKGRRDEGKRGTWRERKVRRGREGGGGDKRGKIKGRENNVWPS